MAAKAQKQPQLSVEQAKITDLKPAPYNPRQMSAHDAEALKRSLTEFGPVEPAVVNKDGTIIGGHMRVLAAAELGWETFPVLRVSLKEDKARLLNLALNRISGEWDEAKLEELIFSLSEGGAELTLSGFEEDELGALLDAVGAGDTAPPRPSLRDRFLFPPFSVLDGKHPDWQERERRWLDLGIRSEVGRDHGDGAPQGGGGLMASATGYDPNFYVRKEEVEKKLGHKLSTAEFKANYWTDSRGNEASPLSAEGTSVFSPVLCEIAYRWFSPPQAEVLDPFAGGSVRGIVASLLERRYQGLDLAKAQLAENRKQAKQIVGSLKGCPSPKWKFGPAQQLDSLLPKKALYDLLFSCPPYFGLEKYTDDERDLSRMKPAVFVEEYRGIIAKAVDRLRPDRFAVFVVGDARDGHRQLSLVTETIRAFEDAGASHYNHAIYLTPVVSAAVRAPGFFRKSRKLTRVHQHLLVFVKGDPVKATKACGELEEDKAASNGSG